jgi:hypothetical protein
MLLCALGRHHANRGRNVRKLSVSSRVVVALLLCTSLAAQSVPDSSNALAAAESLLADLADAHYIAATIDSGLFATYHGKDGAAWHRVAIDAQKQLLSRLAALSPDTLSPTDQRALARMRDTLKYFSEAGLSATPDGANKCSRSSEANLPYHDLRMSLYACFGEIAEHLQFEGKEVNRVAALGLLGKLPESARRKKLLLTFVPLWRSINADNTPASPYRRLIALAAAESSAHTSRIGAAAKTLGVDSAEVESWLEQILDAWRAATPDKPIEPWDFHYTYSAADRELAAAVPLDSLQSISERYYRDLGADLSQLGVLSDTGVRPGKAPLAYTDFVTVGRTIDGVWHPSIARVSANNADSGLGILNELVHEYGHAVHMSAIHTRPAFMDTGDELFTEAFAEVPSWETYDPDWQRKYLGASAPLSPSLQNLYSSVILDVAWGLFELRMLRAPKSDPNAVWTEITSRYLHIRPHPECSWWALRVQLVHVPGYMINYGLGAVLTADLRTQTQHSIGPFQTGNPRWYPWLSETLLRFGTERETSDLLRAFLGRPVSPNALLADLRRLAPESRNTKL